MDIPNLTQQPIQTPNPTVTFSPMAIFIIIFVALVSGFWLSRFFPKSSNTISKNSTAITDSNTLSTDKISDPAEISAGKVYGNSQKSFKDIATGTVEKGSINGEGTHILIREGGLSQRASLISSTVDLDLFVGKKVEVKGETNASTKTSWLLDVGNIKVLE